MQRLKQRDYFLVLAQPEPAVGQHQHSLLILGLQRPHSRELSRGIRELAGLVIRQTEIQQDLGVTPMIGECLLVFSDGLLVTSQVNQRGAQVGTRVNRAGPELQIRPVSGDRPLEIALLMESDGLLQVPLRRLRAGRRDQQYTSPYNPGDEPKHETNQNHYIQIQTGGNSANPRPLHRLDLDRDTGFR